MARSKSSPRWLREHFDDPYVRMARQEGYRSRAVYKLKEIQQKDSVIRPGQTVIDLGAAPGGWSQYVAELLAGTGWVVAVDIMGMDPLPNVTVLQADFTEEAALTGLTRILAGRPVNLVLSDMAPNISGQAAVDQPRAMYLAELAVDFATRVLVPGGDFLVKVFQGTGFDAYVRACRGAFATVYTRKPRASRPRSREVYLLARDRQV